MHVACMNAMWWSSSAGSAVLTFDVNDQVHKFVRFELFRVHQKIRSGFQRINAHSILANSERYWSSKTIYVLRIGLIAPCTLLDIDKIEWTHSAGNVFQKKNSA